MDDIRLTPEMMAALRRLILGHTGTDAAQLAADRAEAAIEAEYVNSTGLLAEMVRSWIDSDEFYETWATNATFGRVQGSDALRSPSMAERPLVHVHIPKTAGTSLNSALASHLPSGEVFAQRTVGELLAMPLGRLLSFRFLAGHWGTSIIDLLQFRQPFSFTMARDPHEQIPSMWRFLRSEGRIPEGTPLEVWLVDTDRGPGRNPQTRALVRRLPRSGVKEVAGRGWLLPPVESLDELAQDLDVVLPTIDLAAPSERVADLYRRIVRECGLPGDPIAEFPRLNSTERAPISAEARELIDSITSLDRHFYELCIERWEADA